MRILLLAGVVALSGCAIIGSTSRDPTALADGATAGMWSSRQPDQVSGCLRQVELAAPAPERGDPLRFQVDPANPRQTRYTTRVSVFGDVSSNRVEAEAAASCL